MDSVVFCISQVLEILQILLCVNYLFCLKYQFRIHDAIFMIIELMIVEVRQIMGLNRLTVIFCYLGIYIYAILKFKCNIRRTNVNIALFFIISVLMQILCSMPLAALTKILSVDVVMLLINAVALVGIFLISRKGRLKKVSDFMANNEILSTISTIICFVGAIYILVQYKLSSYLRPTDYLIFGVWSLLICVLAISWQKEKSDKMAKEKEIELRDVYDSVYQELVSSVRRKQHDVDNQFNVIFSQHQVAKSLDELIAMQREYFDTLICDNKFAHLLSIDSPILGGFLYSKFIKAEEAGCEITYDIRISAVEYQIPLYKVIDILGVLLDNAIEAVENRSSKKIFVMIQEASDSVCFQVENTYDFVSREEMKMFTKLGYSTKGNNRGIGLSNVVDTLAKYDSELYIQCIEKEEIWLSFQFNILL